jgi:hypothetical protein
MSLNNSSTTVENSSAENNSIDLTTDSSPISKFTPERIMRLLKSDSLNYTVIKNTKSNLSSICWQIFGLPAKKSSPKEEFELIPNFVSCDICFRTYSFAVNVK